MITERQIKSWKQYCREPLETINGYDEAINSNSRYDCHHINELTFTRDELINMNMYYHRPSSELIILKRTEHHKLHNKDCMPSSHFGSKNVWYGVYEENHSKWKGDSVCPSAKYIRALKLFKRGLITEEELQPYRDLVHEYNKRKHNGETR